MAKINLKGLNWSKMVKIKLSKSNYHCAGEMSSQKNSAWKSAGKAIKHRKGALKSPK